MSAADGAIVRPFRAADRRPLVALWHRCELTRSWNDPDLNIDRKLAVDPDGLLVAEVDDQLIGSVMVGYDGHRGWVNYLAVHPARRGDRLGARLMDAAETLLRGRGCPKLNLQVRTSNAAAFAFYEAIGYERDDVVSFGRRLIADDER